MKFYSHLILAIATLFLIAACSEPRPAAPRTAPGNGLQLAVFPEYFDNQFTRAVILTPKQLVEKINGAILKGAGQDASIVSSYTDKPLAQQNAIREHSWEGFISKDPRLEYVVEEANRLGVDAVLMYRLQYPGLPSTRAHFTLFLIDLKNVVTKQYSARGEADIYGGFAPMYPEISNAAKRLFEKYRKDAYLRKR